MHCELSRVYRRSNLLGGGPAGAFAPFRMFTHLLYIYKTRFTIHIKYS